MGPIAEHRLYTNAGKTAFLSCHKCLINTGVEKNEQHINRDKNFDHQICL
jgi:hypothetical protein